jgi:predicted flap endonuclease-1-like 5' DNA nuclease
MAKLSYVEGIGEKYAAKLRLAGVGSTDSLLKAGSTPKGRTQLAGAAEVSEKLILEWVNHVDLFRIKGIGQEYADLLEEAGVDTVPELAQRKPENLYEKLVEVNQQKKLVRVLPSTVKVRSWINQARNMPRIIEY